MGKMFKDTIQGKLNIPAELVMYTGGSTETATVIVDNSTRKITADVKVALQDVLVDNKSVVYNKIAYIELEPIKESIITENKRAVKREDEIDLARVHKLEIYQNPTTQLTTISLLDGSGKEITSGTLSIDTKSIIEKVELKHNQEEGWYLLFTRKDRTTFKCLLNDLIDYINSEINNEKTRALQAELQLNTKIEQETLRAIGVENTKVTQLRSQENYVVYGQHNADIFPIQYDINNIPSAIVERDTEGKINVSSVNLNNGNIYSAAAIELDGKWIDSYEENKLSYAGKELAIQENLISEQNARIQADTNLNTAITNETTRAEQEELSLTTNLNAEIQNRTEAISNEANLRSNADNTLTSNLNIEVTQRKSEDNRLDDRINSLQSLGRYLSTWNASTGQPGTYPAVPPTATYPYDYEYKAGDYFIITNVSETGTKYKPDGTKITKETAESAWTVGKVEESETIKENDYYIFDGTNWHLIINTQRTVTFSSIAGSARDNLNLKVELEKVDTIYKKEGTTVATGLLVDEITARTSDIASVRAELSAAIASEVSARNTAIASAKTEAISAAASDATTKANTAEANAKAYTYSQSDIDNKDTAVLASAKSYTDSKISAEVTARNTAIASAKSEAIASAASYTDACIVSEVSARNTAIGSAISALSAEVSGMAASKTLKTLAEADGKISATFEDIKISVSQITDLSLLDTAVTLSETIYTDQVVGKIHGSAQQAAKVGDKGDSLNKVFHNIFGTVTEAQPTIIAEPSISVSFSTANAELGAKINSVNYTITTEDGKYTYEDITGVNFTKYTLSGACAQIDKTTKTGTVNLSNDYYIGDTAISFNCVGEHSAGNIAKTNLGNASNPPVQITAGTKTTSATFSSAGYIPSLIMLSATLPENFDGAKVRATTIKGTQTISGGSSSTYMYLIVPTTTTINSIKASGFDVPFSQVEASKSYIVNNNRSANFRVYKTDGTVTADTFVIA